MKLLSYITPMLISVVCAHTRQDDISINYQKNGTLEVKTPFTNYSSYKVAVHRQSSNSGCDKDDDWQNHFWEEAFGNGTYKISLKGFVYNGSYCVKATPYRLSSGDLVNGDSQNKGIYRTFVVKTPGQKASNCRNDDWSTLQLEPHKMNASILSVFFNITPHECLLELKDFKLDLKTTTAGNCLNQLNTSHRHTVRELQRVKDGLYVANFPKLPSGKYCATIHFQHEDCEDGCDQLHSLSYFLAGQLVQSCKEYASLSLEIHHKNESLSVDFKITPPHELLEFNEVVLQLYNSTAEDCSNAVMSTRRKFRRGQEGLTPHFSNLPNSYQCAQVFFHRSDCKDVCPSCGSEAFHLQEKQIKIFCSSEQGKNDCSQSEDLSYIIALVAIAVALLVILIWFLKRPCRTTTPQIYGRIHQHIPRRGLTVTYDAEREKFKV